LREKAKDWLLSLPKNSIDSWAKCKDAFIRRYYPPAKIIALRSNIIKFSQFDGAFPLIFFSWMLNAMLHVLLFWEDPFFEL
jgi:hypothetical protein